MNLNNITVKQLENINYGKENMGNSFEKFLEEFQDDSAYADYYIQSRNIKINDQYEYIKDDNYKKALFEFIDEKASSYGYDTEKWLQDSGIEV